MFIDDIVIYSKAPQKHEEHLRLVFWCLREHKLYGIHNLKLILVTHALRLLTKCYLVRQKLELKISFNVCLKKINCMLGSDDGIRF